MKLKIWHKLRKKKINKKKSRSQFDLNVGNSKHKVLKEIFMKRGATHIYKGIGWIFFLFTSVSSAIFSAYLLK